MTTSPGDVEAIRALPTDEQGFDRVIAEHRRDLVVLCYRFLGSLQDAEDAAQETALRAWRGRRTYRGESGLRTWLHRIATRVCLDAMEQRNRRWTPLALGGAADPDEPPAPPTNEITWLEPMPDAFIADAALDPAARHSLRESVSLAFTAALQLLPPRQRAVLILRDVLAWPAAEAADALGITSSALTSALHRARTTLQAERAAGRDVERVIPMADPADRRLLDAYMRAWESDDVDGLVNLVKEEVRLAMPPSPAWYSGRDDVIALLRRWVMPRGPFRMYRAGANLQPAALLCVVAPDGSEHAEGLHVLTLVDGAIEVIDAFMDPEIASRFVP